MPVEHRKPFSAASALRRAAAYAASFPKPIWLLAATLVESTGRFMVVPYLSLYMKGEGVSLGALGFVLGAAPIASVAFGAWGGHLADRWGRKPVQILGVSLSASALFGFAFAGSNVYVLALLNFLNGMTRTFYRPATNAAIADFAPPERRSEAYALHRIAINAAFGWGPLIGVGLFLVAPRTGFIVSGVLNLLVGVFIALAIPESSSPSESASPLKSASPLESASPSESAQVGEWLDRLGAATRPAWRAIAADGVFWLWTFGMMLVWGAYDLIQSFLPLHLTEAGVPLWVYGSALTVTEPAPGTFTTHTLTDGADPACTAAVTVFPPARLGVVELTIAL
ncbi:MAG TPA: MFS transporter, partial [Spirochaetales bacterium]|nr:MFS transporter [Spirochaetales bacterium]